LELSGLISTGRDFFFVKMNNCCFYQNKNLFLSKIIYVKN